MPHTLAGLTTPDELRAKLRAACGNFQTSKSRLEVSSKLQLVRGSDLSLKTTQLQTLRGTHGEKEIPFCPSAARTLHRCHARLELVGSIIESYEQDLASVLRWLTDTDAGIAAIAHITAVIGAYQICAVTTPKRDGSPLAAANATPAALGRQILLPLPRCRGSARSSIPRPRSNCRRSVVGIPHGCPTAKEMIRLLDAIDTTTLLGSSRSRHPRNALLDRHSQCRTARLTLADFDLSALLTVRRGKGGKDRVVPLGPVAVKIVARVHRQVPAEALRQTADTKPVRQQERPATSSRRT